MSDAPIRPGIAKPARVQRKRVKGWRMPDNTVYVGRPTKWGNPFAVDRACGIDTHEDAVEAFETMLVEGLPEDYPLAGEIRRELRGKNLACWCPLGRKCHADRLLEIANDYWRTPRQ